MNVAPYTRVAKIHLVPVDENDQLVDNNGNKIDAVVLTVTQKAAMKIEDNRAGTHWLLLLSIANSEHDEF